MCRIFYSMKSFVGPRWSVTAQFCHVTVCSRRTKENNWTSKAENFSNLQLTLFHMCSIFFCMKSLVATCWSFTNRFCPVTVCWVRIQNTIKDQRLKISDLQLTFIQICRIFYSMKSFVGPRWSRTARFCPVTACSRRIKITNEHQQSKDENLDSATYHFSILHPPSAEVSSYPFFFAWRISLTLRAPTSICFSGSKLLRVCGTVLRV